MEEALLQTKDERGVVTLTMNRPASFNALSQEMLAALQEALDGVARDDTARVVVLAANGKAFCPGHNLKEMIATPQLAYYQKLFAQCSRVMLAIQQLPVPVIARVHGIATAAGCQLVAQCDLAVASTDAKFAVSGVNLGLFCSTPSVPLLRNVPAKFAMEMLVTGDFISAQQALERGLVNRAVAPDSTPRSTSWSKASWPSRAPPSRWARSCSTASARWGWKRPISWPDRPWPQT